MKILYAIQGTGNGHISRARDIIPVLLQMGELDILISGTEAEVELPYPIKFRFKGLSFVFGKKGGIDLMATYKKGNLKRLYTEIRSLPIENYDIVINDFEPVSAWACKLKQKECIGLSHQAAVVNKNAPKPKKKLSSLNEVDPELIDTFEKLGINLNEQKMLTGVAVDAVMDSVSVATTFKQTLAEKGIIFCSFSEAVREHSDLVKKYCAASLSLNVAATFAADAAR